MDNLLQKATRLIEEKGWHGFELGQLIDEENPAHVVYERFTCRMDVLTAMGRYFDQQLLKNMDIFDEDESKKDRLFSLMMTRMDVLAPHKAVIAVLWRDLWKDPLSMALSLPLGLKSMTWILQSAGVETQSWLGVVRLKAFAVCYLSVIAAWLEDHDPDMDVTMKVLDSNLDRLSMIPRFYE
ncbi:MAG: hypothetical protein KBB83_07335 [Alphaproteobacteria bacterium]|nr:hypothetical protein [Alphaproteobacteria bacterium]